MSTFQVSYATSNYNRRYCEGDSTATMAIRDGRTMEFSFGDSCVGSGFRTSYGAYELMEGMRNDACLAFLLLQKSHSEAVWLVWSISKFQEPITSFWPTRIRIRPIPIRLFAPWVFTLFCWMLLHKLFCFHQAYSEDAERGQVELSMLVESPDKARCNIEANARTVMSNGDYTQLIMKRGFVNQ